MVHVTFFDSDEDMWEYLRRQMDAADSRVEPWQTQPCSDRRAMSVRWMVRYKPGNRA